MATPSDLARIGLPASHSTCQDRRATLEFADSENRMEGLRRTEDTAPLFEQWIAGSITDAQMMTLLLDHHRAR